MIETPRTHAACEAMSVNHTSAWPKVVPYDIASGIERDLVAATKRSEQLEAVVLAMLVDVVPHTRDTGHNAADREMREAIKAARAVVAIN